MPTALAPPAAGRPLSFAASRNLRYAAQQTLSVIVEKRPELADAALSVAKTAAPKLGRPALNNSTRALLDLVS